MTKEELAKELVKEDFQVLMLAYAYAKNLYLYGIDVTKTCNTVIGNVAALDRAYRKGYYDGMYNRMAEMMAERDDDYEDED